MIYYKPRRGLCG